MLKRPSRRTVPLVLEVTIVNPLLFDPQNWDKTTWYHWGFKSIIRNKTSRLILSTSSKHEVTERSNRGTVGNINIPVYLMVQHSATVESSAQKKQIIICNLEISGIQINWCIKLIKRLTEAQCNLKEDGESIRTGHDSWTQEATAIACSIWSKIKMLLNMLADGMLQRMGDSQKEFQMLADTRLLICLR